jgi:TRAP-type uncharacterized transport system fused permease subunit
MGLPVTAAYIVLGTLSAPALYQLILQSQLADILAAGQLPETAKAIFMLAVPEKMAALSAPMPLAEAQGMIAALPLESLSLLYDQAFQPEVLAVALLSAHMIIFWLSQDSNVTPPVCLAAFTGAAIAESPPMKTGFAAWKVAKGLYFVPLLFAYTPFLSGNWPQMLEIFAFAVFGLWAVAAAIEGYWENRMNIVERIATLAVGAALMWPSRPLAQPHRHWPALSCCSAGTCASAQRHDNPPPPQYKSKPRYDFTKLVILTPVNVAKAAGHRFSTSLD